MPHFSPDEIQISNNTKALRPKSKVFLLYEHYHRKSYHRKSDSFFYVVTPTTIKTLESSDGYPQYAQCVPLHQQ